VLVLVMASDRGTEWPRLVPGVPELVAGVIDEKFLVPEDSLHNLRDLLEMLVCVLVPFLPGLGLPSVRHPYLPGEIVGVGALPVDAL
jgi:hypothetical protein